MAIIINNYNLETSHRISPKYVVLFEIATRIFRRKVNHSLEKSCVFLNVMLEKNWMVLKRQRTTTKHDDDLYSYEVTYELMWGIQLLRTNNTFWILLTEGKMQGVHQKKLATLFTSKLILWLLIRMVQLL